MSGDVGGGGAGSAGARYGLTLAEVCDAAYLAQREQLERLALHQVALLPHLDEAARRDMPTVDQVLAEFDGWLYDEPEDERALTPEERRQLDLHRLLGVAKGR